MVSCFFLTQVDKLLNAPRRTESWSISPSVDMLLFDVTIPATVPQRSEISEGLTNYPVYFIARAVSLEGYLFSLSELFSSCCFQ